MNHRRERVDRVVIGDDLISVRRKTAPQRRPLARARADDDALCFTSAGIDSRPQVDVELVSIVRLTLSGSRSPKIAAGRKSDGKRDRNRNLSTYRTLHSRHPFPWLATVHPDAGVFSRSVRGAPSV